MSNVAIGYHALCYNTTGSNNTAIVDSFMKLTKKLFVIDSKKPYKIDDCPTIYLIINLDTKLLSTLNSKNFFIRNEDYAINYYNQNYRQWLELYMVYKKLSQNNTVYMDIFKNIMPYYVELFKK